MQVYSGELVVEGGEFELFADRIVIRDSEVAFMFSGLCECGEFNTDGIANHDKSGVFSSGAVTINYPNFNKTGQGQAKIRFLEIKPSLQKRICKVAGDWTEDGQTWLFSGKLAKFRADANKY